ncbi:MAG: hypothetical protein NTU41_11100, partial [Chloroflexi bacterium]|nr:hypothetical protein [Chloroflexota bacterium]
RGLAVHLLPGRRQFGSAAEQLREMMGYLARVQVGDATNLDELLALARVPYPILAVAAIADTEQIAAVQELSLRTDHLTVVALEGFGEGSSAQGMLGNLRSCCAKVILCRRGELGMAFKEIDSLGGGGSSPTPARRVSGVRIG